MTPDTDPTGPIGTLEPSDPEERERLLQRERTVVAERLGRNLEALERKGEAVAETVSDVAAVARGLPPKARRARAMVLGAAAGGAAFALAGYLVLRRRRRATPLVALRRALARYGAAPRPAPSLFTRLVKQAAVSLVTSAASAAFHMAVERALSALREGRFDPASAAREQTSTGAVPDTTMPPSVAPPAPIAPLDAPPRELI